MNKLALLTIIYLLTACSTTNDSIDPDDYRGNCGWHDKRDWQLAHKFSGNIEMLRSLADSNPNFAGGYNWMPVESWFSLPTGELMLCRTDREPYASCSGQWWQFEKHGSDFVIVEKSGWICVT